VLSGGGIQWFLLARPSPFPSALIQRGDSWPPLPRVELIQKVSTRQEKEEEGGGGRSRKEEEGLYLGGEEQEEQEQEQEEEFFNH